MRCVYIPSLACSTRNGLGLLPSVFITFGTSALFKISVIGVAFVSLSSVALPMILQEDVAGLVTNLVSIAVGIIITSSLAYISSYPIFLNTSYR